MHIHEFTENIVISNIKVCFKSNFSFPALLVISSLSYCMEHERYNWLEGESALDSTKCKMKSVQNDDLSLGSFLVCDQYC